MSERSGIGGGAALAAMLTAAATPWLPPAAAAALLAALAVAWLAGAAPARARWAAGALLAAAAALVAAEAVLAWRAQSEEGVRQRVHSGFEAIWSDLEGGAERAAADLAIPVGEDGRLESFQQLAGRVGAEQTLLLLNPDRVAVAWAGRGLLHDLEARELPAEGRHVHGSYHAVTLAAVRNLGGGSRPWRLVAGRSFATDELPFEVPGRSALRWSLLPAGEAAPSGVASVEVGRWRVTLDAAELARDPAPRALGGRRAAAAVAGLALLAVAGLGASGAGVSWRGLRLPFTEAAGAAAMLPLGFALALGPTRRTWLLAAAILAAAAARLAARRVGSRGGRAAGPGGLGVTAAVLAGLAAGVLPLAAGWRMQAGWGPVATGALLLEPGVVVGLRLTLGLLALAPLLAATSWRVPGAIARRSELAAWLAAALLAGATALLDRTAAAALLVAAAGVAAGLWAAASGPPRRAGQISVLALLTALVAAAAGEVAYRAETRRWLGEELLAATAPSRVEERLELSERIDSFFAGSDLAELGLRRPEELDQQDLGFELWKASPMSRRGALSALVVERGGEVASSFSFGLTIGEDGELESAPTRNRPLPEELVAANLVAGEAGLASGGEPWGRVRYWLLLRPGFRLHDEPILRLAQGLLREAPRGLEPVEGLLGPIRFAFYDRGGKALIAPWPDPPPIERIPRAAPRWIETPDGEAWAIGGDDVDGTRALLLPRLSVVAGLESVGTHALATLLPIAALAVLALLSRLPAVLAAVRRAASSYSERLLLVYGAAVLVPVLLLNFFLARILAQRLEDEQLASGRAALASAESILGEYLSSLEPGFGIDTALDSELLSWLARVLRHDINLYWGSQVYASSKRELFTAGLLPRRIPGEVYSRLALGGAGLAARTNQAWGAAYLELYSPVRVPGVPLEALRLAASMPLLAQEAELAEEVASLRRKVLLLATALGLLLAALGARLARSFTEPLEEIVAGTQRIAAGAASLDLAPADRELESLVTAIDRMAARIAESRGELVREKQVVDRMLEHINSGVVSVDAEGRVLMRNRLAKDLLGVEIGDRLERNLAAATQLEPLAGFLDRARGGGARQRTVELTDAAGEEHDWSLVWVPLPGPGEPAALLVVEDVTEVVRGQRLQAWAEMARIIAHEIKNPLTPIRLSAEHMLEVRQSDPEAFDRVFERCTRNILEQVGELQQISSEFLTYSRIPRSEPERGDLAALLERVVESYRAAPPPGIELVLDTGGGEVMAMIDDKLLARALRNLIENALRATRSGGRVEVSLTRNGGEARISIGDDGPGVPPALLPRIFDPYFSTHDSGTGLGLPIARRIAEDHGGSIHAANRPGGGLEVSLRLPAL